MGKLQELDPSSWIDDLYQIETTDPVLGGPNGIANQQAKQLGARTAYLRAQLAATLRLSGVNYRPDAAYQIQQSDIGKVVLISSPDYPIYFPDINGFPAYQPFTVVFRGNGHQTSIALQSVNGQPVREFISDPNVNDTQYVLQPGARIVVVSTGVEWFIVFTPHQKIGPVTGSFMESAVKNNSLEPHWLYCDGRAVDRTQYGDLYAAIGTTYGAGDGSTTFNIPDRRGVFARGFDDGRGKDAGRVLGSNQDDAFQGHTFGMQSDSSKLDRSDPNNGSPSQPIAGVDKAEWKTDAKAQERAIIVSDGSNGVPRIAAETRPTNIALAYYIKS